MSSFKMFNISSYILKKYIYFVLKRFKKDLLRPRLLKIRFRKKSFGVSSGVSTGYSPFFGVQIDLYFICFTSRTNTRTIQSKSIQWEHKLLRFVIIARHFFPNLVKLIYSSNILLHQIEKKDRFSN